MNRCELADTYHKQGYSCSQSVLAAFSDKTGLSVEDSFNLAGGFGGGAGAGEMCGALCGAVMVLGALTPVDPSDPVASKRRVQRQGKDLLGRFSDKFGAVRCADLLKNPTIADEGVLASAKAMGLTKHCDIMINTAVEILEEMLAEMEK